MSEVYLNGAFVPLEEARIPVMDRGFLFGDGVYEVIPVYRGLAFRLEQHMERLARSLEAIRLHNPLQPSAWSEILARLIGPDRDEDQLIYLQVTRGADPTRNHLFRRDTKPTVLVMAWPLKARDPQIDKEGLAAITLEDNRWQRCDIKATALLANVLLRQQAEDSGAEEAILIRDGLVTEGSSTNPFVVCSGEILTPPKSHLLLSGVTRDLVLELARNAGLPCTERHISRAELQGAEEVWICSSSREIQAVTKLDNKPVGAGVPGDLFKHLYGLFQEYKARMSSEHG